jgi:aminoglycoside phosphotransferase
VLNVHLFAEVTIKMENLKEEIIKDIPEDLKELIREGIYKKDSMGMSAAAVYEIKNILGGKNAYLKINPVHNPETLSYEKDVYEWLSPYLPVPEIYYYSRDEKYEYLLMSEIEGFNAADNETLSSEELAILLARGLRQIHSIDISSCPFDTTLNVKLQQAKQNVEMKLVDEDDFNEENEGKSAEDIYNNLVNRRTFSEDLVFTHGDYCFPNIILKNKEVSGFIDMGRAGIADRYQDIALFYRSMKYNLGSEKLFPLFLKEYGLEKVDWEKIDYYILLDELF